MNVKLQYMCGRSVDIVSLLNMGPEERGVLIFASWVVFNSSHLFSQKVFVFAPQQVRGQ